MASRTSPEVVESPSPSDSMSSSPLTALNNDSNPESCASGAESSRTTSTNQRDVSPKMESPVVETDFRPGDPDDPRNWPSWQKILLVIGPNVAAFVNLFGNSVYAASIPGVQLQFHVSSTLAISPISFYALGQVLGPALSTSLSEIIGRRVLYQVSGPLGLIFTAAAGSAKDFPTMVVLRFLGSLCIAPTATIGIGVINDLWNTSLSRAGTLSALMYALMMIFAPSVGPMAGAAIVADFDDWRWSFWLNSILLGVVILTTFFGPETYKLEILRRRAKKRGLPVPSRGDVRRLFLVAIGRPLHMLIVEPIVFPTALVGAVYQAVLYFFYIAYPLIFEELYQFTPRHVGEAFAPILVGNILSIPVIGLFDKWKYQSARAEAVRTGGTVRPELRLYPAMLASITMPVSLFWLAWTAKPNLHWAAPMLSGVLFGLSYVPIVVCYALYKNDLYGVAYGASAFAADTLLRFLLSAAAPLFTMQLVHAVGFGWSISLLAFVTLALTPVPWVIFWWGPALRARSRYAPRTRDEERREIRSGGDSRTEGKMERRVGEV